MVVHLVSPNIPNNFLVLSSYDHTVKLKLNKVLFIYTILHLQQ